MSIPRVLVDANVLYSRTLRDWLALISLSLDDEPYRVYWTEDILAETLYRLRRKHPGWDGRKIADVRDKIERAFEGGRVEDFVVDTTFPGRDADDAHVHAAALACDADILLTADNGFVGGDVDPDSLPYEVFTPDEFFVHVDDTAPVHVETATANQTRYWRRRSGRAPLGEQLARAGCPRFAERVRAYQSFLSF
jgi:predicted nucleic acid-binding protein